MTPHVRGGHRAVGRRPSASLSQYGAIAFGPMPEARIHDVEGENVRRGRLRADGQRPLAMNLKETISLTRKLFELRDAAQRVRERTGI